jgi:Ca2+-binding RTX toxin-like protein
VDLAIEGRAPLQVDVIAALNDAIAAGTASFWQRGDLATQARVSVLVPDSSMRLVFDVTAFKGGGFEVDATFANDRAMEAVGGRLDYDVTVRMNGATVLQDSLSQAQYQNWHEAFSSDGRNGGQGLGDPSAGWLNIRHDIAKLGQLGVVADYDLSLAIPESLLASYLAATEAPGWGDPFAANGVTTYMPMVGGRADLGITTLSNSAWLISQDARAAAHALGQAEAATGITWQFWDQANGTWLNTDNYPRLWVDARGGTGRPGDPTSTGLTQQRESSATTGWTPEKAHQPELSFVPYVMTGERWILDNLNAQAAWNLTETWPFPRQDGVGLLADSLNVIQVRSVAWGLRQIENALWAAPEGSSERLFLEGVSDRNWSWLVSKIPEWTALQGEAHGYLPIEPEYGSVAPWQQDYFASTVISAASRGNEDALTYLNWAKNFLIGRFLAADEGFSPRDGVVMLLRTGDLTTREVYKTWSEIGAATVAAGMSHGWTGWNQETGEYGRLALSTLAGIYHLTGDLDAFNAYRLLVGLNYPRTSAADFAANPQYAVTIPGVAPASDETITLTHLVQGGTIDLGAGADRLILASAGANSLQVRNVETVQGGGGADRIVFLDTSAQTAIGGDGNDTIDPGAGVDTAIGGRGDDLFRVDSLLDRVEERAGEGTDRVISTVSLNLMAHVENLTLLGNTALNAAGNGLNNVIIGTAAANRLNGSGGDDSLWGMDGADTLWGGAGHDRLDGQRGADFMAGGTGDDTYAVDDAADVVVEQAGGGTDRVIAYRDHALAPETENLSLVGAALRGTGNAADNVLVGNALANTLFGMAGADRLIGDAGADTLDGGAGDDVLNGSSGADSMIGGEGNDVYVVDSGLDRIVELAGAGIDRVIATLSISLGAMPAVENVWLSGILARNAAGNALANQLIGTALDNALSGGDGDDVLWGLEGNDVLRGDAGADLLAGGLGNDVLAGGAGADRLIGGPGSDVFRFGPPGDGVDIVTDFASGIDRIEVSSAGFGGFLALGPIGGTAFSGLGAAIGTAPQFIYSAASGTLSWDADGQGGIAAVTVAIFTGTPALTASDFRVIA